MMHTCDLDRIWGRLVATLYIFDDGRCDRKGSKNGSDSEEAHIEDLSEKAQAWSGTLRSWMVEDADGLPR